MSRKGLKLGKCERSPYRSEWASDGHLDAPEGIALHGWHTALLIAGYKSPQTGSGKSPDLLWQWARSAWDTWFCTGIVSTEVGTEICCMVPSVVTFSITSG